MKKIKYYLVSYTKVNKKFRNFVRKVLFIKNRIKYILCSSLTIDKKMIMFESYNGKSYSDSPKFIYEYMTKQKEFKDYTFVWAFRETKNRKLKNAIIVKKNTYKYYKYYSKSKYWIVNSLVSEYIFKKKNQVYIQTWHGTPLKKLRYDIKNESILNTVKEIRKRNDTDVKKIDYLLSPSRYCTEKFTSAFNLKGLNKENIIVEKGYPRNANILDYKEKDIKRIKSKLKIPENKKVILYVPTFRDNQHTSCLGYTYKLELDFDLLKEELKDYIVLFKSHYFVSNTFSFKKYKNFIYDVSNYEELNDLYAISDMLLTDYSSVMFDYAILNKPMIFYMYDLEEYKDNLRGFYINYKTLPGPIVQNQKELIKSIKNIKFCEKKYKEFNEKYNYLNTKNATKDVVEYIFKRK